MRSNVFHGECWIPTNKEEDVREMLSLLTTSNPSLPPSQLKNYEGVGEDADSAWPEGSIPPTYFATNAFTGKF